MFFWSLCGDTWKSCFVYIQCSVKRLKTSQNRIWDVSRRLTAADQMYAWDVLRRLKDVFLASKCFQIFYTKFGRKTFSIFFYNEFGCKNFSNFFCNEFGCKKISNFFTMNLTVKNFWIFFTLNLAVKTFRIFLYSRINFFFFLIKNEKSSHVSQTPYWVTMLFSRPRWFFFQGVPNIWGIPFRTFSGLFGELKTFRGNLGPHVL